MENKRKHSNISINELGDELLRTHIHFMKLKNEYSDLEIDMMIKNETPWKFILKSIFGVHSSAQILQRTCAYNEYEHEFEEALEDVLWSYDCRDDSSWSSELLDEVKKTIKRVKKEQHYREVA